MATNIKTDDLLQQELLRQQAARRASMGMRTPALTSQQPASAQAPVQPAPAAQPVQATAQQPAQQPAQQQVVQQPVVQQQAVQQPVQQPMAQQPVQHPVVADTGEASIRQRFEARKKASNEQLDALERRANATYDSAMKPYETVDYATWLQRMGEPSVEEQKRRQKRARSSAIIAGVGDVLASLANVWATTKGAKSTYKSGTLSAAAQARAERIADEGAKLRAAYRKYRYANDEAERKAAATTMRARMEAIMKITGMRLKEGNDLERALNSEIDSYRRGKVQASQIARNEAGTKQAEAGTRLTEARARTENELRGVKKAKEVAQAASARALAAKRLAGVGEGGDGKYEFLGKHYKTEANYSQAVMKAAKEAGVETNDRDIMNKVQRRPVAEIAAEVEMKLKAVTGQGPEKLDDAPQAAPAARKQQATAPAKPQAQSKPKTAPKPQAVKKSVPGKPAPKKAVASKSAAKKSDESERFKNFSIHK